MKKIGFVMFAALTAAQVASAVSLRDVRLHLREVPTQAPGSFAGKLTSLIVYGDGEAVRVTCEANRPVACDRRTLRHYNAYQMDQIHRLVDEARDGEIRRAHTTARCIVAPATFDRITADNERVFLKEGHICTSIRENTSPAARRLVRLLESLRNPRAVLE